MHFSKLAGLFFLLLLLPHLSQAGGVLVSGVAYYSQEHVEENPEDCEDEVNERAGCPVQGVVEVTFNIYRGELRNNGSYQCNDVRLVSSTGSHSTDHANVTLEDTIVQYVEFAEGTIETIEEIIAGKKYKRPFLVNAGDFSTLVEISNELLLSHSDLGAGDNTVSSEDVTERMAALCIGVAIEEEMVPRMQHNPVPFASLAEYAISLKSNGQPQLIDGQLAVETTPSSTEPEDAVLLIQTDYVEDTTASPFLMALQTVVPPPEGSTKPPKTVDVLTVKTDGSTSLSGNLFLVGGVNGFVDLGLSSLVVGTGTARATLDYHELGFLDGTTSKLQTQIDNLSLSGGNPFGLTIESAEIVDGTIVTADIADSTITTDDIAVDTIAAVDIVTGGVATAEILDDTIASADIAGDTITAADIATGAVGAAEILDGVITTTDIATDTITAADIAAAAVGTAEIVDGAILAIDIATGAVDAAEIVDNSVTATDLAATLTLAAGDLFDYSAAIGDGKGLRLPQGIDTPLNVGNVEGLIFFDTDDNLLKIYDGAAWASITGGGDNPFGSAIDSSEITDGTVASVDIAVDTIAAVDIASNAVATAEILDGTIANADLANNAVTTAKIADGTIDSSDIGADVIMASNIATGAITAPEIPDTFCLHTLSAEINPTEAMGNSDYINLLLGNASSTIEANMDMFMTAAMNGYANNFMVTTNIAPENGPGNQSWDVTLRINSADTVLTCAISETATSCGAPGVAALIAAGAKLTVRVTTMGTPVATSALNVAFCLGQ